MTELRKVSDWIGELGTHSIMANNEAKESFTQETGEEPCWGEGYSKTTIERQIVARGKGGSVQGPDDMMFISTVDIAEACAQKYVPQPWFSDKMGMGFIVDECVDKIKESGK